VSARISFRESGCRRAFSCSWSKRPRFTGRPADSRKTIIALCDCGLLAYRGSFRLLVSQSLGISGMSESIQLSDGSAIEFDRERWTGLASQECDNQTASGRIVTPRLAALAHTDGRVVVFATVKDGFKMSAAGGEVLASHDKAQLVAALGRLAGQFSRGPFLLKQCLAQLEGKLGGR
jgi:hypothetical protein